MAIVTHVVDQFDGKAITGYAYDDRTGQVYQMAIFAPDDQRPTFFALIKNGTGTRYQVPDAQGNWAVDVSAAGLFHTHGTTPSNFGTEGGTL